MVVYTAHHDLTKIITLTIDLKKLSVDEYRQ
jgi:hypothetical protein